MELLLVRCAEGPSQLERDPESPRRLDVLSVFANQADLSSRDAFVFEVVGQPANGARAVRSDGYHERGGYSVSDQELGDLPR